MKNLFSLAMVVGWVTALSLAGPAKAQGNMEIATWAGFRNAVAVFTFDDGCANQLSIAVPIFDNYGYKASFYLVTNWVSNYSAYQALVDKGYEVGSHSDNHAANAADQRTMPDSEIASSKSNINSHISGQTCNTITYPNCEEPDETTLRANYIGGRVCANGIDGATPSNYYRINSVICGSTGSVNSAEAFQGKMQQAINQGGWVTFLIHEVDNGNGYSPTSSTALDGALSWAQANDSKIWVTTFRNAIMYSKERNASTIAKKSGDASSETYTLTHSIADNVSNYDYPLSIRVQNSNNWTSVSATQDGKAITASIKDGYIYFDAVPNGGDIVISSGGSSTNPTSSSSATVPASSYSITSSGSTISITVEMEDYDQGGQGVAYNDLNYSEMEKYVTYRTDDAGIVSAGDGYAIGYTKTGEWFNYTMSVPCTGQYKVLARASTGNSSNTKFTISAVGAEPLQVSVSPTTSWDIYAEIDAGTVRLTEGSNSFKVSIDDDNVNVDWIKFIADGVHCPGIVPPQSSASSDPQGNVSDDTPEAIPMVGDIHWIDFSGEIYCQVFDMKGQLLRVKSGAASQGAAGLWNAVNRELPKGVYIMRYGRPGSIRTIQVRK